MKLIQIFNETYQEEKNSTFTHDDVEYDLNALLRKISDQPVVDVPLDRIDWVLDWDDTDPQRLKDADPDAPIIVSVRFTVVDGLHRLAKAKAEGRKSLKAKIVSDESLDQFVIEQTTGGTLGSLCTIKTNFEDADFWLTRKGSSKTVGTPVKTYSPEHIGIKVIRTDILLPQYLYYMMMQLQTSGVFARVAKGTLQLVHITTDQIRSIPVGSKMITERYDSLEQRVASSRKVMADIMTMGRTLGVRTIVRQLPEGTPGDIEITDMFAKNTGQGDGTKLMEFICERADKFELNIYLKPESPRSKEFFEKFGFRKSRHFGMLVRFPPLFK